MGKIAGYTYLLDLDEAPAASSATYGLSLSGKHPLNDEWSVKYYGEYAYQEEYGDNTTNYGTDYYHIAPAVVWKDVTATLGYEVMGSDNGAIGFSTPLATLHKFNGWADKFLTTPAKGLEDLYVDIAYIIRGIKGWLEFLNDTEFKFQYHNFSAEEGSSDYGDEIGVSFNMPIGKHYYIEARYADYDADSFATDTQKFMVIIKDFAQVL